MKWLLEQKHCTGDEEDHYHRTPLHYAAESGQLKYGPFIWTRRSYSDLHLCVPSPPLPPPPPPRAIQALCDHGVNLLVTDDKGNLAVELANDSKCMKYLEVAMKKKVWNCIVCLSPLL